jgi:hypothetical protein
MRGANLIDREQEKINPPFCIWSALIERAAPPAADLIVLEKRLFSASGRIYALDCSARLRPDCPHPNPSPRGRGADGRDADLIVPPGADPGCLIGFQKLTFRQPISYLSAAMFFDCVTHRPRRLSSVALGKRGEKWRFGSQNAQR